MSHYVLQVYRYESIIAAFRAGGQSVDVEVTASDYFKWTKYNGIPAALIAVCSCSIHSLLSHVIQDICTLRIIITRHALEGPISTVLWPLLNCITTIYSIVLYVEY